MRTKKGLSLVELLIASAIFISILAFISRGLVSSSTVVSKIINEAQLIEDTRSAGQIISDSINRAVYIYPPNKKISLNSSGSWTVENPNGSKNIWLTGQDPIIAFIEAAKQTGTCNNKNKQACLYFVAYYPIKRNTVVKKASYGQAIKDNKNNDAWVLFEYRKRLDIEQLSEAQQPPLHIKGSSGKLLADFIAPEIGFKIFNISCKDYNKASTCNNNSEPNFRETISSAEFILLAQYHKEQGLNKSPEMVFSISARNLY